MQNLEEFLRYFGKVRARTLRVSRCIPETEFETSPIGKGFTFGGLLRHIAGMERFMFAENVAGRPSRYTGHDAAEVYGREETLAYVEHLHAESMEIFMMLGQEGLEASCTTPGDATMTAWKWLRSMIEHEAHHRGQIYLYLAVLGVPAPPLYGLTAEEVASRSTGDIA